MIRSSQACLRLEREDQRLVHTRSTIWTTKAGGATGLPLRRQAAKLTR